MRVWLLVITVLLAGCGEKTPSKSNEAPRLPKIVRFYGNATTVPKGESVTLCYGTENVETVTLTPYDEDGIGPSFNRCVAHTPTKDTTYVLTAKGPGGETTSSFTVRVGAAKPKVKELIKNFQILGNLPITPGKRIQLCYTTDGAEAVSLQPAVKEKLGVGANRCFMVTPDKTTTYILSATAADSGVDRMQVTVTVQ
jgi:hypothetical protein